MFTTFLTATLNILFPPRCVGCSTDGAWVCRSCLQKLTPIVLDSPTKQVDTLFALGTYKHPLVSAAVQQLKYRGGRVIAQGLGEALATVFGNYLPDGIIVPVPLHRRRQSERGFNQSWFLAKALQGQNRRIVECIERIKNTVPQVTLQEADRAANVHDAFRLRAGLEKIPEHAIIVDDVFTTGATISEVARVLRTAGVKKIIAVTVGKS